MPTVSELRADAWDSLNVLPVVRGRIAIVADEAYRFLPQKR